MANVELTGKDRRWEEKGTTADETVGWHHWLSGLSLSKLREMVKDREARRAADHGVTKSQTQLRDWTTTTKALKLDRITHGVPNLALQPCPICPAETRGSLSVLWSKFLLQIKLLQTGRNVMICQLGCYIQGTTEIKKCILPLGKEKKVMMP